MIRPESHKDYRAIISLILRSFREGLFSRFPLSRTKRGSHIENDSIVMLALVAVHADYFHEHIGLTMLMMGIQRVKEYGFKGITVEEDYHFYQRVGFKTSSEFGIDPTQGIPMNEPKCMMCQELYEEH